MGFSGLVNSEVLGYRSEISKNATRMEAFFDIDYARLINIHVCLFRTILPKIILTLICFIGVDRRHYDFLDIYQPS